MANKKRVAVKKIVTIKKTKKTAPAPAAAVPDAAKKFPYAGLMIGALLIAGGVYAAMKFTAPKPQNSLTVDVPAVAVVTAEPVPAATKMPVKPKEPAIPSKYKHLFKEYATKEEIPKIHIEEATVLFKSGKALFVDARGAGEYNQSHIKGSVSIPAGTPEEKIKELQSELKDKVLVSYCHGAGCHLADKTANALYDMGYKKVIIFFGGWPEWTQANMPVESYQPPEKYAPLFADVNSAAEIRTISLEEAKFLYDMSLANFIDVDTVEAFGVKRIERSHSVPYDKLDEMIPGFINFLKEKPAVIYCDAAPENAKKAAERIFNAGARKILLFPDAINSWDKANYPMYKNPR